MKTSSARWDVAGVILGLAAMATLMWKHRHFIHDDAYISLRYARNFAEHGVLQWNLGERVEGYTNFLHVVMSGGLIRLGLDPLLAARCLNGAAAVALLLAVVLAARRIAPDAGPARMLAVLAVGATPAVAVWVLGGLEAVVVAAFLAWGTFGLIVTFQNGRLISAFLAGVAFSLAILTRLDAAVFIAGAGVSALMFAPRALPGRFVLACLTAALPAAVAFAHMAWRLEYYGLPFPLTFYAKTGVPLDLRLDFLAGVYAYVLGGIPILFIALVAALANLGERARLAMALALPVVLQLGYILWSGGDHMPAARVMVPLVGALALLLVIHNRLSVILAGAAAALSLIIALSQPPLKTDPAAFVGTIVGRYLDTWPAGQTISLATAGSTPFHAHRHIYIDQLGLNDPVIAMRKDVPILTGPQLWPGHSKGDGAYILSRQPDAIILGPAQGTTPDQPWFLSDAELARLPEFARCYERREETLPHRAEDAAGNPGSPSPTVFTWYQRVCPKT